MDHDGTVGPGPRDAAAPARPPRPQVLDDQARREESQGWIHDAADADTGRTSHTVLDRPLAPVSRSARLAALADGRIPSIFDGPSYRVSPRQPFHAATDVWMSLFHPSFVMPNGSDFAAFTQPVDVGTAEPPEVRAHFGTPLAVRRHVVTARFQVSPWPQGGVVRMRVFFGGPPATITVPVSANAQHTVDVAFTPLAGQPVEVLLDIHPGVHSLDFWWMTLQPELPLLTQV